MTSPTTIKGEMACIEVEKRAIQKGAIVSRPNLETRYDRIIDWKGKLYRAQIKWCDRKRSASEGSVVVKAIGVSMGKSTKKYSENEVDLIFAYIPKTSKVYWLPISLFKEKNTINLRFEKSKNNYKSCNYAEDYVW